MISCLASVGNAGRIRSQARSKRYQTTHEIRDQIVGASRWHRSLEVSESVDLLLGRKCRRRAASRDELAYKPWFNRYTLYTAWTRLSSMALV